MSDKPELTIINNDSITENTNVEEEAVEEITDEELEKFYVDNKEAIDLLGGLDILEALLETSDENFLVLEPAFISTYVELLNQKDTAEEVLSMLAIQELDPIQIQKEANEMYDFIDGLNFLTQLKKDFLKKIVSITINTLQNLANQQIKFIQIPCELEGGVQLPTYAREGDAGLDIFAREEITINPGETKIISTGIKVAIPDGYALLIQPRSGMSVNTKLRVANTPGLIDSGYRDDIGVIIENIEPPFKDIEYDFDDNGEIHIKSILHGTPYTIVEGQKFAQMRLVQVPKVSFMQVQNVGEIGEDRGGGFGSTDLSE